jgi:hypothetical protein
MYTNFVRTRNPGHERGVARDEVRFGCDPDIESAFAREYFQDLAGDLITALGRLVRIGGGAYPYRRTQLQPPDLGPKRGRLKMFGVDFAFEQFRIAQFHEFVSIAGVAVFTAIFAAAIRIDGPDGTHPSGPMSDEPACFQFQVFHLTLGFEHIAGSGQASNSYEFGGGIIIEQHRKTRGE